MEFEKRYYYYSSKYGGFSSINESSKESEGYRFVGLHKEYNPICFSGGVGGCIIKNVYSNNVLKPFEYKHDLHSGNTFTKSQLLTLAESMDESDTLVFRNIDFKKQDEFIKQIKNSAKEN